MLKIILLFMTFSLIGMVSGFGQGKLKGSLTVVDSVTAKPIANAIILMGESSVPLISTLKGEVELTFVSGSTLAISHVGYVSKEITISNEVLNLKVFLIPKNLQLEEVVINTGYEQFKKNKTNGSIIVLDNEVLNQQMGSNILKRMESVTSGLAFNRGFGNQNVHNKTSINIRGISTINGALDPLIVLDNFIYAGSIDNINPGDVESITVLKDAAATSIWGAKAGNGVIVITTKKGKFQQKTSFDFNTSIQVRGKPDLHKLDAMDIGEYLDMEEMLFNKGYFNSAINRNYTPLSPAVEVFVNRKKNAITAQDSALQIHELKKVNNKDQYMKYAYRQEISQRYNVSSRGGSEAFAWFISGALDKNVMSLGAEFEKLNLLIKNAFKPTKKLSLDLNIYYTSKKNGSGKPGYESVIMVNGRKIPYLSLFDENGGSLPVPQQYRKAYTDTAGAGLLLDWNYYPFEDYRHERNTSLTQEILADIAAKYQVVKSLTFSVQYQYQTQKSDSRTLSDLESFYTRNTINLYSQINRTTGSVKYIVPLGDILKLSTENLKSWNVRTQLNFNKLIEQHSVSGIAGFEAREISSFGTRNQYYDYNENPISSATNIDYLNTYPTFLTGAARQVPANISFSKTNNRYVSIYANASYSFRNKYSLYGSARKDGSNILGLSVNDKWKPLWSVGAGWNIFKEDFYSVDWLPDLKLRVSYGKSGNIDLSKTALPLAQFRQDASTGYRAAIINRINNPNLKWEVVSQYNVGVELATRNKFLQVSVDYFIKYGSDLYGETPYDYTGWGYMKTLTRNIADVKGNGIDAIINFKWIDKRLKWNTRILYNYVTNKTTKYFTQESKQYTTFLGGSDLMKPVIGKPLHSVVAYKWGGLDASGNPQGYLESKLSTNYTAIRNEAQTGGLDERNLKFFGSAIPLHFGSIVNSLEYRGIELFWNLSYKLDYYFMKPAVFYGGLIAGNSLGNKEYSDRWQQPGDEQFTNVPSLVYPNNSLRDNFYQSAEIHVRRGDHVRFQYAGITYNILPKNKEKSFKRISISLNVSDLGIVWRKNELQIDPDYINRIPVSTSYGIGINVGF